MAAFTPDTPAHARLGAGGPWSHVLGTGGAGAGEGDGEGGDGLEVTARVLTAIEAEAATAAPTAAACSEAAIACVVAMGAPIVKNTMSNEQAMKARATRWRGCIGFCRGIDITPSFSHLTTILTHEHTTRTSGSSYRNRDVSMKSQICVGTGKIKKSASGYATGTLRLTMRLTYSTAVPYAFTEQTPPPAPRFA